jgi:hypothetical protein
MPKHIHRSTPVTCKLNNKGRSEKPNEELPENAYAKQAIPELRAKKKNRFGEE